MLCCLFIISPTGYLLLQAPPTVHGDDARVGIYSQPLRCKSYILLVPVYTCASWWHFLHYMHTYRVGRCCIEYIHGFYASILVA